MTYPQVDVVGPSDRGGDSLNLRDNKVGYSKLRSNEESKVEPELEQSAEDEKTNESIRLYFKTSKAEEVEPPKQMMNNDEIRAHNQARQERIWARQEYKANPTKRRKRKQWR